MTNIIENFTLQHDKERTEIKWKHKIIVINCLLSMFADKRCSILGKGDTHYIFAGSKKSKLTMDDPLLNIYSFKFNEVYIFWHEIKNLNLWWMIHCWTSIVSNLPNEVYIFWHEIKNLNLWWMIHCWTSISSFKFNEVYIFWHEIKNLNLRWMIHCWTSIVSNLMKFIYFGMK